MPEGNEVSNQRVSGLQGFGVRGLGFRVSGELSDIEPAHPKPKLKL